MAGSIFMPEMTNLQVREYLEGGGHTVIVPVGSTEDHGDHGPLWTDVYIPMEIAKRAAPELGAIVGPPVPFGIAHDHRGASGLVHPNDCLRELLWLGRGSQESVFAL